MTPEDRTRLRADLAGKMRERLSSAGVGNPRWRMSAAGLLSNMAEEHYRAALDAAEARSAALIEAMFAIYVLNGSDPDGDRTGAAFLSHCGIGGNDLDSFIRLVHASMDETIAECREESTRADAAEARIAAVEALCADPYVCTCDGADDILYVSAVRAALSGASTDPADIVAALAGKRKP
jgi:hypothetical protein